MSNRMAASQSSSQLLDLVSCGICMEQYDNKSHVPKLLPCQHTFCQSCIKRATKSYVLICPICRCSHVVMQRKSFTTNRAILDVVDEVLRSKEEPSEMVQKDLKCIKHPKKKCVLVCVDCLHGLCVVCVRTNSQSHHGHHLEELEDATTLLQKKHIETIEARKTILLEKLSELHKSPCSSAEMIKAEADIKSIHDNLQLELNTWVSKQLATVLEIKSAAVEQELQVQAEVDRVEQRTGVADLVTLLPILREPYEMDVEQIGSKLKECEEASQKSSTFSEDCTLLIERVQKVLYAQDSLQSKLFKKQSNLLPKIMQKTQLDATQPTKPGKLTQLFCMFGLFASTGLSKETNLSSKDSPSDSTKKAQQSPRPKKPLNEISLASHLMMFIVLFSSLEIHPYYNEILKNVIPRLLLSSRLKFAGLKLSPEPDRSWLNFGLLLGDTAVIVTGHIIMKIVKRIGLMNNNYSFVVDDTFDNGIAQCCKNIFVCYLCIYMCWIPVADKVEMNFVYGLGISLFVLRQELFMLVIDIYDGVISLFKKCLTLLKQ